VTREYYYNDAGNQIDRFRASVAALRRGDPVAEDGYHGDYVAGLAREDGDPLPRMLASIEQTMARFRIHFDSWALQSELERRLPGVVVQVATRTGQTASGGHAIVANVPMTRTGC
jgi:arginyl-tRNA synthetase